MNFSFRIIQCRGALISGFTLVELLIVMAILAMLATIAMPSYQTVTKKAQRTEGQILLFEVQSHLERYYFANNTYPNGLSELVQYKHDHVASEQGYYEVSLEVPSSACPAINCYRLIAEHKSKQSSETMVIHSNGQKEGAW
jgi:type IV pilus assembly protein PilE